MNKQLFTLEDIEQYLEELGYAWVDRAILNEKTKEYKRKTGTFQTTNKFIVFARHREPTLFIGYGNNFEQTIYY